jgi:DNA-directed RNA polymerase specialized sigma24 family protein
MNSPDVVAVLRAGAPDAAGQLYDAHAEGLYQYCWLVLRSREKAQRAMREAVTLAGARIDELTDPLMLKAWLFAIARAECERHRPGSAGESDEPVAHPRQRDAALRIMAWKSVISLPADEREALELVTRHGMTPPEVALVLGMPAPEAPALIATARQHLEQALAAEILINRESQECAGRADALQGWTGTVTPAVRERLLRHASSCPACAPRLPRNVSAAKIFGLLPQPFPAEGGWAGVLSRLSDPDPADAPAPLTTPALSDAAVSAADDADGPDVPDAGTPEPSDLPCYPGAGRAPVRDARPAGKPGRAHPRAAGGGVPPRRRVKRVYAGIGAAVAAAGVAAVLAGSLGGHTALSGPARNLPAADTPAQAGGGRPIAQPDSAPGTPGTGRRHAGSSSLAVSAGGGTVSGSPGWLAPAAALSFAASARTPQRASNVAFLPAASRSGASSRNPAPAAPASPARAGELRVSPASLSVGTGSYGQIVLTASGGPVSWTASMSSANLTLSQGSGQLSAGQSVTLAVNVRRQGGTAGSGTITIRSASASSTVSVQVTWAADSSPSPSPSRRHRPSPSPCPSGSHSPSPSPSPAAS